MFRHLTIKPPIDECIYSGKAPSHLIEDIPYVYHTFKCLSSSASAIFDQAAEDVRSAILDLTPRVVFLELDKAWTHPSTSLLLCPEY